MNPYTNATGIWHVKRQDRSEMGKRPLWLLIAPGGFVADAYERRRDAKAALDSAVAYENTIVGWSR